MTDEKKDKKNLKTASILVVAFCVLMALVLMAVVDNRENKAPELSLWKDNSVKSSINYFIESINNEKGKFYVKPENRIAVFDLNGTIMVEKPLDIELSFLKDNVTDNLKGKHPFSALIKNDDKTVFSGNNYHKISELNSNKNKDDFKDQVRKWILDYKHPKFDKEFYHLAYKPMLELISYLKYYGFEVYIVTKNDSDFVRSFIEAMFQIPNEHVIATMPSYNLNNGTREKTEINAINSGKNKALSVLGQTNTMPIVVFGNSDEDFEMFNVLSSNKNMKLLGVIDHTDEKREYKYSDDNKKLLKAAKDNGWLIVDMKEDWITIF